MRIRGAKRGDHDAIVKLARQSKFVRDFSSHMFSSEAAYEKKWIRVAMKGKRIVGFTCVRHKVRAPETVLYFIGVDKDTQREGIGFELMRDLQDQSPHKRIALNVDKTNIEAIGMYTRLGYEIEHGDALNGTAHHMAKEWR